MTVSGLDQSKLSLGVDFSHWDGDIPGAVFKRFDYAWIKAADGDQLRPGDPYDYSNYVDVDCHNNVQKAWDADIPCGLYVYIVPNFPNWTIDSIIQLHYKALKAATKGLIAGKSYHAIALDVEEEGRSQTDTNWQKIVKGLTDLIYNDPEYAPVKKGVIYGRATFFEKKPALMNELSNKDVLEKYHLWLAQWPLWSGQTYKYETISTTWEELKSKYLPALNMRVTTPGFQTWDFVQWSACFKLAGTSFNYDLNFFHGDKTACWNWFGFTPRGVVVTPPVDETPPATTPDLKAVWDKLALHDTAIATLNQFKTIITNWIKTFPG